MKTVDLEELEDDEIEETFGEASMMMLFDHPNIIKIKDVFKTKSHELEIVMEYCDKGCLNDLIEERYEKL